MRHLGRVILLAVMGAYAPFVPATGQDVGWISVVTNEPGAHVYADSVYLGRADAGVFALEPGEALIRLAPAQRDSWSIEPLETGVTIVRDDTLFVSIPFPVYYRIESVPYGANVLIDDPNGRRSVGETPLTLTVPSHLEHAILIEKLGYLTTQIEPGQDRWNRHMVLLDRAERAADGVTNAEVPWTPPRSSRVRWIDYGALGLAVASAIVSVHYKFKADGLYDRYEDTGDPVLRDRIERLDTRSAVALGTMQVGLGIFAIRLALK